MASRESIEDALQRLPAGVEVVLRLKDGSEVVGTFRRATDVVELEDSDDAVDVDQVEDVLTVWESPGPE